MVQCQLMTLSTLSNSQTRLSILVYLHRTGKILAKRLTKTSSACFGKWSSQLAPCAFRVRECLDGRGKASSANASDCLGVNTYGCYHNQIPPGELNNNLTHFCERFSSASSVSCIEELRSSLLGTWTVNQGLCLPDSCVTDADQLQDIAKNSLDIYCLGDTKLDSGSFCKNSQLRLSCSSKFQPKAEKENSSAL